jgi:hypothetical protein
MTLANRDRIVIAGMMVPPPFAIVMIWWKKNFN